MRPIKLWNGKTTFKQSCFTLRYLKSHPNLWKTFKPMFQNNIVGRFTCSQGPSTKPSYNILLYLLFSRFTEALMIGPTQKPNTNTHLSFIFLLFTHLTSHKSKVFRDLDQILSSSGIILEFINVFLTLV